MRRFLSVLFLVLAAPATAADEPRLGLPLDCVPSKTCWIANYVDHDPTDGVRDYACGTATYNGADGGIHTGTDFAIRDLDAMRTGVPVVAAAPGVVVGVRDGVADIAVTTPEQAKRVDDRECGNGVRIDHGNGWSTQYCHMRKGSIAVRPDDRVDAGTRLGLVGLSGFTQYPHLHISVRKGGTVIDPFVGPTRTKACGPGDTPLWRDEILAQLPYGPTALFNTGFADEVANPEKARAGAYRRALSRNGKALVVWAEAFQTRKGDRFLITIAGPDGREIVKQATKPFLRDQARRFEFVGKRTPKAGWPAGGYRSTVQLIRPKGGKEYDVLATLGAEITLR